MTTDSPCTLGSVTTRRSMWWPSIVRPTRPSCGTRRSEMSRSLMIFTRLMTPSTMRRCTVRGLDEHAVDAEAHAQLVAVGLEVDVRGALLDGLGDDLVDEPDDRRVVGGLAQVDDLGRAVVLLVVVEVGGDDVVEARQARDEAEDVLAARDRRADLLAGQQRDVVDGEDVGRVGHRDEQRAVVEEADRHRLVALGGRDRDEVRRAPCRAGRVPRSRWSRPWRSATARDEAVGGQRALLDEHVLGHLAGAPALLDRARRRGRARRARGRR